MFGNILYVYVYIYMYIYVHIYTYNMDVLGEPVESLGICHALAYLGLHIS